MLDIHAAALDSKVSSYHEFLARYSKSAKVIYGFVEGKDDPCYYRGFIEGRIPDDWEIELWPSGNKSSVFRIYNDLDWRRFPKKRVCFFVDTDLSSLIPENFPSDVNIYSTPGYSIENSIVSRGTARRVLAELFGFETFPRSDIDLLCDQFEEELEAFFLAMVPLMSWILVWRKNNITAHLSNIELKNIFSFQEGRVIFDSSKAGVDAAIDYIHGAATNGGPRLSGYDESYQEFKKCSVYRKYIRGKYVMWFLVKFCDSVYSDAPSILSSCTKPPKKTAEISVKNSVSMVGNRARVVQCLREFIDTNYDNYITQKTI